MSKLLNNLSILTATNFHFDDKSARHKLKCINTRYIQCNMIAHVVLLCHAVFCKPGLKAVLALIFDGEGRNYTQLIHYIY
jgi:hypothetical protein